MLTKRGQVHFTGSGCVLQGRCARRAMVWNIEQVETEKAGLLEAFGATSSADVGKRRVCL